MLELHTFNDKMTLSLSNVMLTCACHDWELSIQE